MTDAIILDLDGPLLDGVDRHYACYSSILRKHGFPPIAKGEYWVAKRSRMNRRKLLARSGAAEVDDDFAGEWMRLIESPEMLALDRLQPDVLQILGAWSQAGIQLILATMRNNRDNTTRQLDKLGLLPFFDRIFITGSHHAGGKAAVVRRFLDDASGRPANSIWVGDTEVDIQAAQQLRIPVYAVTCGLRTESLLRLESPDIMLSDLRDVRDALLASARESNLQDR